jgi:methionyl aminopeptidase
MTVRNQEELKGLMRAGRVVRVALQEMKKAVRIGVSTQEIDDMCGAVLKRFGARSAPQSVYGFPGAACFSINDETVHGIPKSTRMIHAGDLVKLDVTAELDGFFAE